MPTPHPRPWHRGSLFGAGPRQALDREQRARFRFLLRAHRRVRRISPLAELVGQALLKRLSTDGQCDPAQSTLADDVGCSQRTVRRAITTMRRLGLLLWQTRLVRTGWRAEQTSNAYLLLTTAALPSSVPPCGGQNGRETLRKILKTTAGGPSEGSDDWARWNAARQMQLLRN
jgi:Helix-turn-helix domain